MFAHVLVICWSETLINFLHVITNLLLEMSTDFLSKSWISKAHCQPSMKRPYFATRFPLTTLKLQRL